MDKLLYSKRSAAEMLSVSLRKLDSLIATNQIPVRRLGKRVLIARDALEQFVFQTERRPSPTQAE